MQDNSRKNKAVPVYFAFALLITMLYSTGCAVPQAYGFSFDDHQICSGWTEQTEAIPTDKFEPTGQTVYFYFKISFTSSEEFGETWENFRISLLDPTGAEVNAFVARIWQGAAQVFSTTGTTEIYHYSSSLYSGPPYAASEFVKLLEIDSSTKNGRWKLNWYNGNSLIFSEEFVVGEEQAGQQIPLDNMTLLILAVLATVVVLVVIAVYFSRRRKATSGAPQVSPQPPSTP